MKECNMNNQSLQETNFDVILWESMGGQQGGSGGVLYFSIETVLSHTRMLLTPLLVALNYSYLYYSSYSSSYSYSYSCSYSYSYYFTARIQALWRSWMRFTNHSNQRTVHFFIFNYQYMNINSCFLLSNNSVYLMTRYRLLVIAVFRHYSTFVVNSSEWK